MIGGGDRDGDRPAKVSPLSGEDDWFDDWFDRAWDWLASPPAEDAIPAQIQDLPSMSLPTLPSLPSSMFRSSSMVRGPSTLRRDPMAGETLRATGKDRSKLDALRIECADPLSPIGSEIRWLRRYADASDEEEE